MHYYSSLIQAMDVPAVYYYDHYNYVYKVRRNSRAECLSDVDGVVTSAY